MKIFLVSNMFPSAADGLFGIFVKNFKSELEKQGVFFSKTALIKGQANSFFKKTTNYISHYWNISRGFFSKKHDVVYVHFITHHIPVFLLLSPFKNKLWVFNAHGDDIIGLQKNAFLDFFAKILLKKIDLLVVPTSYFKEKVLQNYAFLQPEKVFISPSGGIDQEKFYKISNNKKQNPKNKFQIPNNKHQTISPKPHTHLSSLPTHHSPLTLGFISRFVEEKGWKTFLDALVLLREKGIPFKAIMAGKGPDEKKIKEYIQQNGLMDCVDFRGFIAQEVLVDIYNELDIYIFPTWHDSLGLTGVEAMACGTPVIASNISGPSTYVKNGENGYLFEPKKPKALTGLIHKYDQLSIEEKIQFRENALKTAEKFEQSHVAKLLLKRLKSLVNTSF